MSAAVSPGQYGKLEIKGGGRRACSTRPGVPRALMAMPLAALGAPASPVSWARRHLAGESQE